MDKDIKLVLCDIDGTLLDSKKYLTDKTKEAIFDLKKQGILFGIASGRPYAGVRPKLNDWKIESAVDVMVTMNGAQLWDGLNQQLHRYFMLKKQWIQEIIETYAVLNLNPCVYDENRLYCMRIEYPCERSAQNNGLALTVVDDPSFFWQQDHEKLLYTVDPSQMEKVERFYNLHPSLHYRGFKSQADLFEFVDCRVSKSYGIQQFCQLHDFTMEEVAAFGDTTNDIEMLQDCGLGICMANGTKDAKAVSNFITRSNDEDGVAWYIQEVLLKK